MTTPRPSGTDPAASPWRLGTERRLLAQGLAESVVTDVAPDELPLFERRAKSHFRPRLWSRRPLSVDIVGLATDVVTPAALSAAVGVLGVMSAELVSRLTTRMLSRAARRRRRAEAEPAEPAASPVAAPAPTPAELARWRGAALSGALRHVSQQRAERVADSVLAELVTMLATDTESGRAQDDGSGSTADDGDGSAATGR